MDRPGSVKVHFRLAQDEDGYPPVAVESVWAQPGANAREFVIDNVPFFAREATVGDTILITEEAGQRWFEAVVHRSRNSLVRVVFFDRTCVDRVSDQLTALGCSTEYLREHNLLAVCIPASVRLKIANLAEEPFRSSARERRHVQPRAARRSYQRRWLNWIEVLLHLLWGNKLFAWVDKRRPVWSPDPPVPPCDPTDD